MLLLKFLKSGLETSIYTDKERDHIKTIRTITDMASLCKYVETHGPVKASALHVDAYKRAVRKLTVTSLMHVPDAVLERQFKTMMHHLQHQDIQKIMHDKEEKKQLFVAYFHPNIT